MAKKPIRPRAVHITERFQVKLENLLLYPCTMVAAPVGFGKTVCLREHLRQLDGEAAGRVAVHWQDAHSEGALGFQDLAELLLPVSRSLRDDLTARGLPADAGQRGAFSRRMGTLQQELERDTVLVIDLGPAALNGEALILLELLVMNLPVQLHLVVLSRYSAFPWDSPLFFYNRVNLANWEDLRFNSEEVERYYLKCGVPVVPRDIQQVARLCEGWGALVRFSVQEYLNKHRIISPTKAAGIIRRMVYDPLSDEEKQILLQLSVFDDLTAEQIRFLCGDDAPAFAARMCIQGLFLTTGDDGRGFLLDGCFAGCARSQFQLLPQQDQNEMLTKAGDWYMATGKRFTAARSYYARARNYRALMRAVQMRRFLRPYAKDEQDFIAYYTICPPEIRREYPQALLVFAKYLFGSNKRELAEKVCREFQESLRQNKGLTPQDIARYEASYQMLLSYEQYNNLEGMLRHLEAAEALAAKTSAVVFWPETGLNDAPSILSMYHRERGQLRQEVELYAEYNTKYAKMTGSRNGAELVMGAEAQYLTGDLREAEISIYEVQFITNQDKQWGVWFAVTYLQIRMELMKGNWRNVEFLLGATRQLTADYADDMLIPAADLCAVFVYCKLRQPQQLSGLFQRGWDTDLNTHFRALPTIYALHAEVLLVRGDYIAVVALYKKYVDAARVCPNLLPEIALEIVTAAAYEALGERGPALEHLRAALELAEPDGLSMPFVEMGGFVGELLGELAGQKGFAAQLLGKARLFGQRMEQIRMEHFLLADSELTPQEVKIAKMVAQGNSNKEIAEAMFIRESTVKTHLTHVFSKLDIKKRSELKVIFQNE